MASDETVCPAHKGSRTDKCSCPTCPRCRYALGSLACQQAHTRRPYVVRSTAPGVADVVDRVSGERVGWVEDDGHQWTAWGVGRCGGERFDGIRGYRADAARAVWEASRA